MSVHSSLICQLHQTPARCFWLSSCYTPLLSTTSNMKYVHMYVYIYMFFKKYIFKNLCSTLRPLDHGATCRCLHLTTSLI